MPRASPSSSPDDLGVGSSASVDSPAAAAPSFSKRYSQVVPPECGADKIVTTWYAEASVKHRVRLLWLGADCFLMAIDLLHVILPDQLNHLTRVLTPLLQPTERRMLGLSKKSKLQNWVLTLTGVAVFCKQPCMDAHEGFRAWLEGNILSLMKMADSDACDQLASAEASRAAAAASSERRSQPPRTCDRSDSAEGIAALNLAVELELQASGLSEPPRHSVAEAFWERVRVRCKREVKWSTLYKRWVECGRGVTEGDAALVGRNTAAAASAPTVVTDLNAEADVQNSMPAASLAPISATPSVHPKPVDDGQMPALLESKHDSPMDIDEDAPPASEEKLQQKRKRPSLDGETFDVQPSHRSRKDADETKHSTPSRAPPVVIAIDDDSPSSEDMEDGPPPLVATTYIASGSVIVATALDRDKLAASAVPAFTTHHPPVSLDA